MALHTVAEALKTFDKRYTALRLSENVLSNFIGVTEQFKSYFSNAIQNDESEENVKNLINKYLEATFYPSPIYSINTHNNIDSVISKREKFLVLIENKRLSNKAEMPQVNNINKKALWELVYYYLTLTRDTTSNRVKRIPDIEIRRLIITDSQSWYIFDANDIEKVCDGYLENHFYNYSNSRLNYNNNLKKFYSDIELHFKKIQITISLDYIYFDLNKQTGTKTGYQYLYKVLNREFLLKEIQRQAIQQHELNGRFYNELLYIMGLEETKQKSNSIITINKKNPNTFAYQLYNGYVQNKEKDVEEAEEKTFELLIIWLNRILFLKLFEGQLFAFNGEYDQFRLLSSDKITDFSDLQSLFFDVLGQKDRPKGAFFDKFTSIPYLNSSLFERQRIEREDYNINDIRNDPVQIMPKSVLRNKTGTTPLLSYLIDFLNSYRFATLDESDNKKYEIIDASVLGLIFEKINGYKDGAVYTPSAITEYMSKNAIEKNILNRINSRFSWNCITLDEVRFNITSIETAEIINGIINSTRICDPAVGSGHFLVSALNQIIGIKAELGVLFKYEKRQRLDEVDIYVEDDVLHILNAQGHVFRYNKDSKVSQEVQQTLFNEKRVIIENCLFGVDINSKAVHICQLRLWIELLKNAYYINDVMQTLPNIDINIRVGNSLISRIDFASGKKPSISKKADNTIKTSIRQYRQMIKEYVSAASKTDKRIIEANIDYIKNSLYYELAQTSLFDSTATTNASLYENSFEWAFEFPEIVDEEGVFIGFDIIIENPPYGLINKRQNKKKSIEAESAQVEYYKKSPLYDAAKGGPINIFRLFICRTYQLLKKDGYASMIFPLAFTCDQTSSKIRHFLFHSASIEYIEAFPERDNAKKRVFESAKMSVCIIGFSRGSKTRINDEIKYRINFNNYVDESITPSIISLSAIKNIDSENLTIPLASQQEIELMAKLMNGSNLCKSYSKCYTGEIDISLDKKYITYDSSYAAMIRGAQVQRYHITNDTSQGQIMYLYDESYLSNNTGPKSQHHLKRRIVLQGITGVNEKIRLKMTIIDAGCFCANSVNYLLFPDQDGNLEYFLGVLNSPVVNWFFSKLSTNSNVNGYEVDNLPIKLGTNQQKEEVVSIVKQLLSNSSSNSEELENQLNEVIYQIYSLNENDVSIIIG